MSARTDCIDRADRIDGPVTRGVDATAMVLAHEAFVRSRVMRWVANLPHLAMHEDDLLQEGRVAIWQAALRFQADRGLTFLTFAGKAVDHLMMNFIRRKSSVVRFPTGKTIGMVFLDEPLSSDAEETRLMLMVPEAEEPMLCEDEETRALLHGAMQCLTARERRVLRGLFVEEMTYTALAEELGFTRSRIPQIKEEALVKLRRVLLPRLTMGEGNEGTQSRAKARTTNF